jgi:AcrR family transcriptional regulator
MTAARSDGGSPKSRGRVAPKSGRGQRTRDAILAAAVRVFGREGVRQTSMLAIAQEAGFASGTVYQYFSDKEDIFRSLLERLSEHLREDTQMQLDEGGRLRVSEAMQRYLEVHRENVAIYRAWWDLLEPETEFTAAWLAIHAGGRDDVEARIKTDQEAGIANPRLDPEITGDLVAMLFERPAYSRNIMAWDEELTDEDISGLIGRLLGDGLLEADSR